MAHDVFISHSSKDKPMADAVCALLEARGIRCWIAPRDVQPGMPYGEAIIDGIHGCRVMVLLLSASANSSIHIAKEVERAVSHGATIIPLRIEAVMPAKSLDYFIGSVHWLDALTPPMDRHLDNLADTILKILPAPNLSAPSAAIQADAAPKIVNAGPVATPAAPTPVARKFPIPVLVGAGVVLAAVIVIATLISSGRSRNNAQSTAGSSTGNDAPKLAGGDASLAVGGKPATRGGNGGSGGSLSGSGSDPVVGCWHWFNDYSVAIHADGSMTTGQFTAQWRVANPSHRIYNFTWPEAVDSATLSADGSTLSGGNQYGFEMSATRLSGGPGLPGTWRWYNGVIVTIQPAGSFFAGNVSGHWRGSGLSYNLTWPKPLDTVTLSPEHNRFDGSNQFGVHISGTRAGSCGG